MLRRFDSVSAWGRRAEFAKIELAYALASQVTLAIRLTELAEESKLSAISREKEEAAHQRAAELARANRALAAVLALACRRPGY